MTIAPQEYFGKTVKIESSFAVYEGESKNYYACIIADATACCSQGFEFVCADDLSYPEDYPKLESEITVQGIFDTYVEDSYTYCQLIDVK